MRTSCFIILTVIAATIALAADNANIAKANRAYEEELYNEALSLYLAEAKSTGTSSQLFYNIANTYFRLKDYPHAVLYYERALMLDPSNADAKANLDFVREKAKIHEDSGTSWLSSWLEANVSRFSSDSWARCAVASFLLLLLAVALYLFSSVVWLRKLGFFGGALLAVVSIVANIAAFHMYNKATSHADAIITATVADLSNAPREPKNKAEVAFQINAGYKVHIHDSVRVDGRLWLDVETTDAHRAWIKATDLQRI